MVKISKREACEIVNSGDHRKELVLDKKLMNMNNKKFNKNIKKVDSCLESYRKKVRKLPDSKLQKIFNKVIFKSKSKKLTYITEQKLDILENIVDKRVQNNS